MEEHQKRCLGRHGPCLDRAVREASARLVPRREKRLLRRPRTCCPQNVQFPWRTRGGRSAEIPSGLPANESPRPEGPAYRSEASRSGSDTVRSQDRAESHGAWREWPSQRARSLHTLRLARYTAARTVRPAQAPPLRYVRLRTSSSARDTRAPARESGVNRKVGLQLLLPVSLVPPRQARLPAELR